MANFDSKTPRNDRDKLPSDLKSNHFRSRPAPQEDGAPATIRLLHHARAWKPNNARRIAVGVAGSDAQLLALEPALTEHSVRSASAVPVLLSGKTEAALRSQAARLREHLEARPELDLLAVAFSLATSRVHHEQRSAIIASDRFELLERLAAIVEGRGGSNGVFADGAADGGALLLSLATLHAQGIAVDWNAWFASHAPRLLLPNPSIQRERFELHAQLDKSGDAAAAGLASVHHPLLAGVVALAANDGLVFTGRLSLSEQPWLAGHKTFGRVVLPGSAFVELALAAAQHVGLERIEELSLETPLVLPGEGAVSLQLGVGALDHAGRRSLTCHSRLEHAPHDAPWTRHASGTLATAALTPTAFNLHVWPPLDAAPLPLENFYEDMAKLGLQYGPDFQGLRAAWKRCDTLFAEIELPESSAVRAERFILHPALLDAALHVLMSREPAMGVDLPFHWRDIAVRSAGATRLRVRLQPNAADHSVALDLADVHGEPLGSVLTLSMQRSSPEQLHGALASQHDALLQVLWSELPGGLSTQASTKFGTWAVLGDTVSGVSCDAEAAHYTDLSSLQHALDQGAVAPHSVLAPFVSASRAGDLAGEAQATATRAFELLQGFLSDERFASTRLVFVTRGAIAAQPHEDVSDLAHAALWGLVRSVQLENAALPLFIVDVDGEVSPRQVLAALDPEAPQLALRGSRRLVPRLSKLRPQDVLVAPDAPAWRLNVSARGSIDNLTLTAQPEVLTPLLAGQVRISVRAAGLNQSDVLDTLGVYPGAGSALGQEGAGVVSEVGKGVEHLAVGDRVMGLFSARMPSGSAAFGPVVVADARVVVRMPEGWSFHQGASVPLGFLTAYFGLVDLGQIQAGQRVLIHAASGGVGMAAVQLARHFGAEVFATASSGKWNALRALGFDDRHIASSRDLSFESHFAQATGGCGMDVVLNCPAGEFIDASLRLMPRGGQFLELRKTDIREAGEVGKAHAGVRYRAYDVIEAGPERIHEMLITLASLFESGALRPVPISCWDIAHACAAFRALSRAQHIGKFVLSVPRTLDRNGSVLITGGTGRLGALIARHLVERHGVKHLLLASRRGIAAPGARELQQQLENAGATVAIAACDVSDKDALRTLLDGSDAEHKLTAVIHAAGLLEDGLITGMTKERVARVFAPKLAAAVHLHELTKQRDLAAFVLFSSLAGVMGSAGQSNHAAANSFLDALARHRRARGLPATSLAWGPWHRADQAEQPGGLGRDLRAAQGESLRRVGLRTLSTSDGLALFDAAFTRPEAALVPAAFDHSVLRVQTNLPATLRGLVGPRAVCAVAIDPDTSVTQRWATLERADREHAALDLVRAEAARMLGLSSSNALDTQSTFEELGFDVLMGVELRNRLAAALTPLRLPASLALDPATPSAIARFVASLESASVAAPALKPRALGRADQQAASPRNSGIFATRRPRALSIAECEPMHVSGTCDARLFCFHEAGGSPKTFVPYAELAARGIEVHTISHTRSRAPSPETARQYLEEAVAYIRSASAGPYALLGHSLGTLLSFQVLHELVSDGGAPPLFFFASACHFMKSLKLDTARLLRAVGLMPANGRESRGIAQGKRNLMLDGALFHCMPTLSEEPVDVPIAAFFGLQDPLTNEVAASRWKFQTTRHFSLTGVEGDHVYWRGESARRLLLDAISGHIHGELALAEEPIATRVAV